MSLVDIDILDRPAVVDPTKPCPIWSSTHTHWRQRTYYGTPNGYLCVVCYPDPEGEDQGKHYEEWKQLLGESETA